MAEEIFNGIVRVTTDTGSVIPDVERVVQAVQQEMAKLGAVQPRGLGAGIVSDLNNAALAADQLEARITRLRESAEGLGRITGLGAFGSQLRELEAQQQRVEGIRAQASGAGSEASHVATLEARLARVATEREAQATASGAAAVGGANGGIVPVANQASVIASTEALQKAQAEMAAGLQLRSTLSGQLATDEHALAAATQRAAASATAQATGTGGQAVTDLNERLQAKLVAAQERMAATLEQEGVLETQIKAAREEVLVAEQGLSIETRRARIAQDQAARGLIFGGAGDDKAGFKPDEANVRNAAAQERSATADPVRTAETRLATAEENYAQVFEKGFATQEAADLAGLRALGSLLSATDALANARTRAAKEEERQTSLRAAEVSGQAERAAVLNNPRYQLLTQGSSTDILRESGAEEGVSVRRQSLQVERTRLESAERTNVAATVEARTTEELATLDSQRLSILRRIIANQQAQERATKEDSGGGNDRTGFFRGLGGSYGGNTEGGLGGIAFQAGQATKYFALYSVLSGIQGLFGSLVTEAEKYTVAVNDLSIALDVGKASATEYAAQYAAVGATYAASPVESVQGATKFIRSFRTDDATGVNQGYSQQQIGSFGAELTSIIQQLEGQQNTTKVTSDLVGLSRAYGVGAAGVQGLYDQLTKVAQFYGVSEPGSATSTAGAISSGTAQIGTLAKASGYDAPAAAALVASVQQASGIGSDQAAGDIKRILGSQAALDKVFEKFQIGGDQTFKERLDKLIQVIATQSPTQARATLSSLGDARLQATVQALVAGAPDQAKARAAAEGAQGTAAEQANKRITESFGGAMDKLATQFDQFKNSVVRGGLLEAAGVLVVALGGVLDAFTALNNLLASGPEWLGWVRGSLAGLAALFVAERALGAIRATIGATSLGGTLVKAFGADNVGPGTNKTANAAAADAAAVAEAAQSTSADAAAVAAGLLTAAQDLQAQSAAAATALLEAQATATTTAAAAAEAVVASEAAGVVVKEADQAVTAALAGDIEVLGAAQAAAAEAATALTATLEVQTTTATAAAAAAADLTLAQTNVTRISAAEVAGQEALSVAQGTATEASAVATTTLTAETVAKEEAALATGGLTGAISTLGVTFWRALPGMLAIGAVMAGIALAAEAIDAKKKIDAQQQVVGDVSGATALDVGSGNLKALQTNQDALIAERAKLKDNYDSFGNQFVNKVSEVVSYPNIGGAPTPDQKDKAALDSIDALIAYNKTKIAEFTKTSTSVTKDSQLGDFFGPALDIPEQGIGRIVNNRLPVGDSVSIIERFLKQAPTTGVERFLNSGQTSVQDSTALFQYLGQRASRSTDPAQRGTDLESIRRLAVEQKQSLTDRGASPDLLAQAQEELDQATKASFDQLLKNTTSRVERIKLSNGPAGRSTPAQLEQIRGLVTSALNTTTGENGSVDSTIALLAGVDQAYLDTYKAGIRAQIATLANQAASIQAALAAATQAEAVVSGFSASMRNFGDEVVGHGSRQGNQATATLQQGKTANQIAQDKLKAQLGVLDTAASQSTLSGSDFKFPGNSAAPTAAATEEARIAAQAVSGSALSAAQTALRLAQSKFATASAPGSTSVEYYTALKALHDAQFGLAQAELSQANAVISASEVSSDPLSQATGGIRVAQANLAAAKGPTEYYTALKALHDAQYALGKEELDQASAADLAGIDNTDPVAQANAKVRAAQRQLSFDQQRGASAAVTVPDRNNLKSAQTDAQKAAFDQQFGDYQTNYDLNRISLAGYLSYLHSQHDYLSAVHNKTRQQVDELNQVDRALKGLTDGLQGQFNLGDIKVPSPYEVRRALVAGSSGGAQTTQYITISVAGGDLAAVRGVLAEYVGQAAMQTTGTAVSKVA